MTKRGMFITLEGGDGAGKSTLLAGLSTHLESQGIDLLLSREPGGTTLGERIRGILLDPALRSMCAESELLLMFAARAQLVRETLVPALAESRWVLCDRYVDASYAYQGGGRGLSVEHIAGLEGWACAGLKPDLTLLLDLPVATGRARASDRSNSDRIEIEADEFFERVRDAYHARFAAEPERFRVIDASQAPEAVLRDAIAAVESLFAANLAARYSTSCCAPSANCSGHRTRMPAKR